MTLDTTKKSLQIPKEFDGPRKGDGVVLKAFNKKSGILTVTCIHRNEAIALSSVIYDELSSFFIEQMTFTSPNNADVLRRKMDRIQRQLNLFRRFYA